MHEGAPHLLLGAQLLRWTPEGYVRPAPRPPGSDAELARSTPGHVRPAYRLAGAQAELLTPPSLVAILRSGWHARAVPLLHPSAS
jgi:hypothetical protein